jgi:hypothetical protein
MADYAISNVPRRVVYAPSGVGPYAFTFEILDQTDIAVYKGSTLLTLTTDYTVTINLNGTGSVTLVATAGTDNITIVGAKNIQRTSDFTTGGDLFADTLNDELDNQTIFIQQVAETAERGLKAPVTDPTDIAMTLPDRAGRVGRVLAFDSTTGNPVAGPSLDSVVTVIEQSANINTVADNIASVNTVAGNTSNINTVAGVSGNVTTVAGSISNVNTVATNVANVNTVATNITNVNAVGTNIANVNTVAGNNTNINTVSGISADVTTVAGIAPAVSNVSSISAAVSGVDANATDISAVNANKTNIDTVAGIAANVTTVAGISANVTSVAGNSANINTVAADIANVNAVGTNIANVNSVAGNATNINAVAGNSTNINTVAGISANVTTVATNNANVTTVAGSIANVNTNATNIANINQNAANIVAIQNASANATAAANSATAAAGSATSASASAAAASAVALGNEPVRHSVRPSLLLDFANTKTLDPRITFTRASTATFYDGKTVAKAEENLFQRSQEFDNGYWTKTTTTVTANTEAAPDGTTTAETFEHTSTSGSLISRGVPPPAVGFQCVFSVFLKYSTNQWVRFTVGGSNDVWFDIQNGTVGTQLGATGSIVSVGNGWYRCILVRSGVSVGSITIANMDGDNSSTRTTNATFIWGAQLEIRSSVTAYTVTTTAPITNYIPALQTAASGVARFEHNPITGESLGLEIEEQRTNLFQRSEEFDNAVWTKTDTTISANNVIAPSGALTADKLIASSTSTSFHRLATATSVSAGLTYSFSIFAKAGEYSWLKLRLGNFHANFDLATGVVGAFGGTGATSAIQSVGNGWYRCTLITGAVAASDSAFIYVASDNTSGLATGTFAGNGFNGIYIWGAQLEAGAFATSYIPTVASQVTRSADAASMTGTNFSSWYRADEWTLYAEAENRNGTISGGNNSTIAMLVKGTDSNSSQLIRLIAASSLLQTFGSNGGAANQWAMLSASAISKGAFAKGAVAYKLNDVAFSSGGGAVSTDTSAQIAALDTFQIGVAVNAGWLNGSIKKLAFYPARLTNAELVGLSTI